MQCQSSFSVALNLVLIFCSLFLSLSPTLCMLVAFKAQPGFIEKKDSIDCKFLSRGMMLVEQLLVTPFFTSFVQPEDKGKYMLFSFLIKTKTLINHEGVIFYKGNIVKQLEFSPQVVNSLFIFLN